MNFQTLFKILKKHMGDGDDIPYFFRELMAMITDVEEEEWALQEILQQRQKTTRFVIIQKGVCQKPWLKILFIG